MLARKLDAMVFEKLCTTAFAKELTANQCATLANVMTVRKLSRNQFLIREHQRDDTLHIVVRGNLAVLKKVGEDEEVISFVREGGLAGAMGFIDGQEHVAGLRAINDTEVLSLSRANLEQLMMHDPALVYNVMRAIIRSVHGIVRNMNDQYVQLTNYIKGQHGRY